MFLLPVLRNSWKTHQQEVEIHGEGCVCLPLPHINGMIFFPQKEKKEEKDNHPHFNLA